MARRDNQDSADHETATGQKKKHPLGKVLQEFKPKSARLELGIAAGLLLLGGVGGLAAGVFIPQGRAWVLSIAGVLLAAGLATAYLCYGGPSSDYVRIRKLGLDLRKGAETIRLAWNEIEYVDSDALYERQATRSESTATYRAYLGAGGKSIDLEDTFFRQFEDPAQIIKSIRKQAGGTLKHVDLPRDRDE